MGTVFLAEQIAVGNRPVALKASVAPSLRSAVLLGFTLLDPTAGRTADPKGGGAARTDSRVVYTLVCMHASREHGQHLFCHCVQSVAGSGF